ncbi:MAG: NAD(P)H-binding protein, partial [Solirubrobacteraceae bacterium]
MGLIVVAGGHGQVARHLLARLARAGHTARGLIRNADHAGYLEAVGAETALCDIEAEGDLSAWVAGADAVVFAAGAGPGSGPERKQAVYLGGAIKLIRACHATGVERYLMVSAMGAADPAYGP